MAGYSAGLKSFTAKVFANNPAKKIIFLLFRKNISFNHLTIRIIAFLHNQRIPFHNVIIDVSDSAISPFTKGLLYWDNYENAEVTFAKKHIAETDDVIELGSSIGVMGSIVSNKQTTGKYIAVEADPLLISANHKNLLLNRKTDYVLLNKALAYFSETVSFKSSPKTLTGKINSNNLNDKAIIIETITLSEICNAYNFNWFTLVCDIEGAEIGILINDDEALAKCEKMIIELHATEYNGKAYSVNDLVNLIIDKSFTMLDQQRNVFVFKNNNSVIN